MPEGIKIYMLPGLTFEGLAEGILIGDLLDPFLEGVTDLEGLEKSFYDHLFFREGFWFLQMSPYATVAETAMGRALYDACVAGKQKMVLLTNIAL